MNAQRWIAVAVLGLLVLCAAGTNLWFPYVTAVFADDENEATPTPEAAEVNENISEDDATATAQAATATPTAEPTADPVVQEMLADLDVEDLGPGIDPHIIRAGDFTTIDSMHQASGTASIYRISELQQVLRLDPFEVTNGPDLVVILSQQEAPRTSSETMLPEHLELGDLKSPSGAQNYPIPEGTTISQYKSVVIYSMSLNIVYSSAPLTEVRGQ